MGIDTIANTGMQAAMSNMEMISHNIANSQTVGFKKSRIDFADLYPTAATSTTTGLGVETLSVRQNFVSGGIQSTSQALDLSINTSGFFIQKSATSGQTSYTRAGSFDVDTDGYIVHENNRLQGFAAVNGVILPPSLSDLQVSNTPLPANPTTTAIGALNLDADAVVPTATFNNTVASSYNFATNTTIYDTLGNPSKLSLYYIKTAANAWKINAQVNGTSIGSGTASFSNVGLLTGTTGLGSLSITNADGAVTPQVISVNLTGSTQYGGNGSNVLTPFSQDGYESGNLTGVTIDQNGVVSGQYSNSQNQQVGQVAIAVFESPNRLQDIGSSSWIATSASGQPGISQSNSEGSLQTGSLELSNVDLTEEMVNLIGAQHTFQANAQVEQTYNEVIQTILKIQ